MRTPRLFMGVFALALLLPLLLLACGGADEPTDMPDSERATNEPEGRASSGQTTPASPTASAEPSPTPRATAVPTMAQTSPETDRAALVALYNATGGPNWDDNNNWLSDVPISEWEGVTTNGNGRVTVLIFFWNHLTGEIPPELGNLANLIRLALGGNRLSGGIPPELSNLAKLQWLLLNGNQLRGCVPSSSSGRLNMASSDLGDLRLCQ